MLPGQELAIQTIQTFSPYVQKQLIMYNDAL
jgi:hypothetical protein